MKQQDKNILIITIFVFIFFFTITVSHYKKSQKELAESKISQQQKMEENDSFSPKKEITKNRIVAQITPEELYKKIALSPDTAIIDLRNQKQFDNSHIKGSYTLSTFDTSKHYKSIILVTQNGDENELLLDTYKAVQNIGEVFNLKGGFNAWKKKGFITISYTPAQNFENATKIHYVEPRDLDKLLKDSSTQNIFVLDTRRSGNYQKEHIPHAVNIPFIELEYRYKEIPRANQIYVYGADAQNSFKSGILLYNLNFMNVYTINGGFSAWKNYGYPIETNK